MLPTGRSMAEIQPLSRGIRSPLKVVRGIN